MFSSPTSSRTRGFPVKASYVDLGYNPGVDICFRFRIRVCDTTCFRKTSTLCRFSGSSPPMQVNAQQVYLREPYTRVKQAYFQAQLRGP